MRTDKHENVRRISEDKSQRNARLVFDIYFLKKKKNKLLFYINLDIHVRWHFSTCIPKFLHLLFSGTFSHSYLTKSNISNQFFVFTMNLFSTNKATLCCFSFFSYFKYCNTTYCIKKKEINFRSKSSFFICMCIKMLPFTDLIFFLFNLWMFLNAKLLTN